MIYHTTSLTPTTQLDTAHGNDHHTIYPTDGWRVRSMLRDGADQANAVLRRKSHRNHCAAVHIMHVRHGEHGHMPSVQYQNRHKTGSKDVDGSSSSTIQGHTIHTRPPASTNTKQAQEAERQQGQEDTQTEEHTQKQQQSNHSRG